MFFSPKTGNKLVGNKKKILDNNSWKVIFETTKAGKKKRFLTTIGKKIFTTIDKKENFPQKNRWRKKGFLSTVLYTSWKTDRCAIPIVIIRNNFFSEL